MPLSQRDPAYLWDMLDAAHLIQEFVRGITFSNYISNKMIQSAVERQLEILGKPRGEYPLNSRMNTRKFRGGR